MRRSPHRQRRDLATARRSGTASGESADARPRSGPGGSGGHRAARFQRDVHRRPAAERDRVPARRGAGNREGARPALQVAAAAERAPVRHAHPHLRRCRAAALPDAGQPAAAGRLLREMAHRRRARVLQERTGRRVPRADAHQADRRRQPARRVRPAHGPRRGLGRARSHHEQCAREGRPGPEAHRRRHHRRAAEARRPAAGRERVGLPPHGGRAQAHRQRAALDRLRRGGAHPRRRRSPARGDSRRGLPRRAARARRRRRQGGQYLRAGLLAEPGVLLVLPQHGSLPLDLPRQERPDAARAELRLLPLPQGRLRPPVHQKVSDGHHLSPGARSDAHPGRRAAVHRAQSLARDVPPHHADDRRPDPLRRAELDARRAAPPALGKKLMRWLLPEYIEDILPAEAARIEQLRRKILDLFFEHDYELVMPPLLEYMDSLLTGTGRDLELRTFKVVDQLSGRMMGLRADITPQVARIEAHLLEALQRKDVPELRNLSRALEAKVRSAILLLPELYGGAEVLDAAEKELPRLAGLSGALATLRRLARACKLPVSFDLAELRGYHYHSGVVLDAYCDGVTGAVARGGRYDEVGKAFGRARPATGFSIYLRSLAGAVR